MKLTFTALFVFIFNILIVFNSNSQVVFLGLGMFGCSTDNSIATNVFPDRNIHKLYYGDGTTTKNCSTQTIASSVIAPLPHEITIGGFAANTRYYYRMQYRITSGGTLYIRDEHSSQTQRPAGNAFTFTVISDSHYQMNTAHQQTMQIIKNDQPGFNLDMGDTSIPDNYLGVYHLQQLA